MNEDQITFTRDTLASLIQMLSNQLDSEAIADKQDLITQDFESALLMLEEHDQLTLMEQLELARLIKFQIIQFVNFYNRFHSVRVDPFFNRVFQDTVAIGVVISGLEFSLRQTLEAILQDFPSLRFAVLSYQLDQLIE